MRLPTSFPVRAPDWPGGVERAPLDRGLGIDYESDWSRRYAVRLVRAALLDNVTRPFVRAIASPRIEGAEALAPLEPPVIFAANHSSHVDTPLLLTSLPQRFRHRVVVGAAADYFFDRRWKAALWSFGIAAVPIERQRVNRRSAELASSLLADGWSLVIFPEGGRSPDGWGQPFRGGAAYLSTRTGAPIVPVHLAGTRHVLAKQTKGLRRSPTRVTFGAPLRPAEGEDARRMSARLEEAVALLADESATDWWTARQRAAAGETPPLSGPQASAWRRSWALAARPERRPRREWPWAESGPDRGLGPGVSHRLTGEAEEPTV